MKNRSVIDIKPVHGAKALPKIVPRAQVAFEWRETPIGPLGTWVRTNKFDLDCAALADRHYSRRSHGSNQFMPPGQTVCLKGNRAVFGWWRPDPSAGIVPMNGLDGWTCTIFRNESPALSSILILAAETALVESGYDCGPDGLLTYVWDGRVKSANPGYCFKRAGWRTAGRSADDKKTLLTKPFQHAGVST